MKNKNFISIILFLTGCIGILLVITLDIFYFYLPILSVDTWPNFSTEYVFRSILIFVSIIVIFLSVVGKKRPEFILFENEEISLEQISISGTFILSAIFLLLFIYRPVAFSILSLEGELLEYTQFLLFISCSLIFFLAILKSRNNLNISKPTQWSFGIMILIFFLIAMEEISWFQWILIYETPEMFEANFQDEVTFHNFATKYFENFFYFGSFFFLVVMPFLRILFPYLSSNNYLRLLTPRPFICLVGVISCAYNFDMWNVVFIQMAFFGGVVILFGYALFNIKMNERILIIFSIFFIVLTQIVYIIYGDHYFRIFEITEYKEFFIPLAFFIYSLDVFIHLNKEISTKEMKIKNN